MTSANHHDDPLEPLIAAEFPVAERHIYLNHAAISPWPERTRRALQDFADGITRDGSLHFPEWQDKERQLRERLARLVNAPGPESVALVPNTSAGLSLVAAGLDWRAGDNVVITDSEFPSNRMPWEALADQGVEVREAVCTPAGEADCEANVLGLVDERTRVVSVSSVQFGTGRALDLERIGRELAGTPTAFCVDAIQSLGAFPFDAQAVHADFAAADGHKWLLGPEGLGVFYCAPEWLERLRLHQWGWHMAEPFGDFDARQWEPAPTARRFEPGTPNTPSNHALEASLSLLQEVGVDRVGERIRERVGHLIAGLRDIPDVALISPVDPGRRAGIVTARFGDRTDAVYQALRDAGVQVLPRAGGVRFAPHFYNRLSELDRVLDIIRAA
ncbi:MAG: aminotransferase class V-fold PLP-dependent enzyme [Thiohalorhabdus sp.]|uniref:aminotransferase class V-fold PLP-dependent enzyme n=1 Tax=Thiohalorhabdus sp. TaxID=3094134 RepID=UPI00397EA708